MPLAAEGLVLAWRSALGHTLVRNAATGGNPDIGAATAIRLLPGGAAQAAAETTRRGGGSAAVVHPR